MDSFCPSRCLLEQGPARWSSSALRQQPAVAERAHGRSLHVEVHPSTGCADGTPWEQAFLIGRITAPAKETWRLLCRASRISLFVSHAPPAKEKHLWRAPEKC